MPTTNSWIRQRQAWRKEIERIERLLKATEDPANKEAMATALEMEDRFQLVGETYTHEFYNSSPGANCISSRLEVKWRKTPPPGTKLYIQHK